MGSSSPSTLPPPGYVVVTGATGFLGKPLIQALLHEGYTILALVRNPLQARKTLPESVHLEPWDGATPPPPEFIQGAKAVIHLAGESLAHWPWSQRRKQVLLNSRVLSTQALLAAIQSAGHGSAKLPEAFIMASGMGYHGNAGLTPVTESSSPGSDFLGSMASAWETAAYPANSLGVRVVALRFGMILAPQGGALAPLKRLYRLGLGARLGSGKQGHPWIHRDDAIGLFVHALTHPELQGSLHACAPSTPSQWVFAKTLGKTLRRPVWPWTPTWAIRFFLGEFADLLLHGQFGQPLKAQASKYGWKFPHLDLALKDCVSHT